jgi:DNA repair protein REV1
LRAVSAYERMKKSQGKGGRSFDSVPADDGFRNYMSRKIELQRKQFGLVLPPSPDSPSDDSSPDTDVNLKPAAPLHNFGSNKPKEQLESSAISSASDSPSRKSVRFHTNLEQVAPITSVSDVLENLKQKDSVRKSSLRRRRYGASETQTESAAGGHSDNASMIGILNKLQKRHGSSSKRKRPRSVLETLESANDKMSSQKSASGNRFDETAAATANPLTQIDPLIDSYGTDTDNNLHTGVPLKDFDELSNEYSSCHSQPEQQAMSNNPSMQTHEQAGINNDQDTNVAKRRNTRPDLFFSGIVVLINGHTDPDATTLMRLLHKHGGDLEKYETRRVTHIIAERLSTAKANIYKNQKNPTPVCRPEWITDSVRKGKLLPFGDYLLEDVIEAKTPGTKSLKTFFGPEKSAEKEPDTPRWADTDPSKSNYHINGQVRTVGNDPNFLES